MFKSVFYWHFILYVKCSNQEVNIALHHYEYKLFMLLQAKPHGSAIKTQSADKVKLAE